jgi:LysR family transcriptional regulator, cyn operon transcriptional activator
VELRQLESFLAVAEVLHFRRAASRVHLSQPALSRQIQQLERELGTPLFERAPGRVALTDAGKVLHAHAQRALEELRAARAAVAQTGGGPQGHLALACFDSASTYLVPDLLARMVAHYPRVSLSVATLGTRDAVRELRERGVDAAIVTLPIPARDLEIVPLYREELVVALPPGHPLAQRRRVPVAALAPERLVTFLAGQNNTRRLIDDAFAAAQCAPRTVIELESVQAIKDAVRSGLGVAILGDMTLSGRARDMGVLARPLAPARYRDIGLATRARRQSHPLLTPLLAAIRETAAALGLPALVR